MEKRHGGAQRRLLLEQTVPYLDVHGLHKVGHLLFSPLEFIKGRCGYRNEYGHVKQVLISAGQPLLDVVASLDRAGQFLIIRGCVLQFPQLGAVEPDALCHPVDGLAADLPAQMQIHIDAFTSIDQRRHPTAPYLLREPALADVEVSVVHTVHDDIARMAQIEATGRHEVDCTDLWDWIDSHHSFLGRHGIHHHTVKPTLEGVVHAGAAVEVHVEDLRHKGIFILGLHNAVAALGKVSPGVLRHRLKGCVDLPVVGVRLTAHCLILENQEEPAGQGLPASLLLDEADGALAQFPAGGHIVLLNVRLQTGHIPV